MRGKGTKRGQKLFRYLPMPRKINEIFEIDPPQKKTIEDSFFLVRCRCRENFEKNDFAGPTGSFFQF